MMVIDSKVAAMKKKLWFGQRKLRFQQKREVPMAFFVMLIKLNVFCVVTSPILLVMSLVDFVSEMFGSNENKHWKRNYFGSKN